MMSFSEILHQFDVFLTTHLGSGWALAIELILVGVALLMAYAILAIVLIYVERKVCAFFQCRIGPDRVGFKGLLQVFADVIKILLKELIPIKNADHFLFRLAPFFVIIGSLGVFAAIPFAEGLHAVDFNVGLFYLVAVSSLGTIGTLLAGWASNSKYTMMGAIRSGAQMISYSVSVGLALLSVGVLAGSLQLSTIVEEQADLWFIFKGHVPAIIAYVLYLIAGHAETSRGPFDLPEAEHELTAGFHTEYSGIQFGFFYLSEYLNMFIIAAIAATLFLGGWQPLQIPGLDGFNEIMAYIPGWIWFFAKTAFNVFMALWVRWSFPRLRIDQLLNFEWKILMPIGLVNLLLMAIIVLI